MVSLNDLYRQRFILGLGVSHIPMVEGLRGHRYDKPLSAMRAYLDGIHKDLPSGQEAPVMVAALGPKMLALSAEKSLGAVPYNVTPKHTAQAAAILGPNKMAGRRAEGDDRDRSRPRRARSAARSWRATWCCRTIATTGCARASAKPSSPTAAATASSTPWCLWGDAATIKKGLRAHFEAGATHVCLQPVHADGDFAARDRCSPRWPTPSTCRYAAGLIATCSA